MVVLQADASSLSMQLSVYDVRGRRRAGLTIPPGTTWLEWEPRSDDGELLPSGSYFLRVDGMESVVRFTFFR
jgi:hypothetical protein